MGVSMSLSVQEALFYLQRKENPGAPGYRNDSEGKHSKGCILQRSKLDVVTCLPDWLCAIKLVSNPNRDGWIDDR